MSSAPIMHHRAELWGGRDPAQESVQETTQKESPQEDLQWPGDTWGSASCIQEMGGCSKSSRGPSRPRALPLSDCSKRPRGNLVLTSQSRWPGQQPPLPPCTHAPALLTHSTKSIGLPRGGHLRRHPEPPTACTASASRKSVTQSCLRPPCSPPTYECPTPSPGQGPEALLPQSSPA